MNTDFLVVKKNYLLKYCCKEFFFVIVLGVTDLETGLEPLVDDGPVADERDEGRALKADPCRKV